MDIPVIAIARISSGLYKWAILYGSELVDSDVGDSSIAACLSSALAGIPDDTMQVEVRYHTVGMGTFSRVALEEDPEDIAETIANCYGTLFGQTNALPRQTC